MLRTDGAIAVRGGNGIRDIVGAIEILPNLDLNGSMAKTARNNWQTIRKTAPRRDLLKWFTTIARVLDANER
jgi:hypothetical protein